MASSGRTQYVNKYLARLGGVTKHGTKDLPGTISHYLRGADRVMFTKTRHDLSNILGRRPKPWLAGSLAFAALVSGWDAGEDMVENMNIQPQQEPSIGLLGETPVPEFIAPVSPNLPNSMTFDGIPNMASDLNSTGIVQALHKNRHG